MVTHNDYLNLVEQSATWSHEQLMAHLVQLYPHSICFSTSFGAEDQVITDLLQYYKAVQFCTLDTGRLFAETYSTWSSTLSRYKINIVSFYPNDAALQDLVTQHGPNSFYESVALRKACCGIRKVEPLGRALQHQDIWITGIRAAQSNNREQMQRLEWDEVHQVIKYHPILNYTDEEVWQYIRTHHVPYNVLHDKQFVSIGCAPCTRAIKPGEDFRAGRWWWEDNSKKECGLHTH